MQKKSKTGKEWSRASHSRRYFVSRGHVVSYFERPTQSQSEGGDHLCGVINLRDVVKLRPTADSTAPENAFDLVLRLRTYTLVPFPDSRDERDAWLALWSSLVPPEALLDSSPSTLQMPFTNLLSPTYPSLTTRPATCPSFSTNTAESLLGLSSTDSSSRAQAIPPLQFPINGACAAVSPYAAAQAPTPERVSSVPAAPEDPPLLEGTLLKKVCHNLQHTQTNPCPPPIAAPLASPSPCSAGKQHRFLGRNGLEEALLRVALSVSRVAQGIQPSAGAPPPLLVPCLLPLPPSIFTLCPNSRIYPLPLAFASTLCPAVSNRVDATGSDCSRRDELQPVADLLRRAGNQMSRFHRSQS